MSQYTAEELQNILEKHSKWLIGEEGGERADLRGAILCKADLFRADLFRADLCEADLRGADLRGADLRGADLRGADLFRADLREADLREADLFRADLFRADLCEADLREAKVDCEWIEFVAPLCCPEIGSFIGWKRACHKGEPRIVKLLITEDAKRSSGTGRKCRCSKAKVLAIETVSGKILENATARSYYDSSFIYRAGETVEVQDFDEDRFNECSTGIHFFITRQEAVFYNI